MRIAEICGYKRTALSDTLCIWTSPTGEKSDTGYDPWNGQLFLPNYLGSLDAMSQAEAMLTDEQHHNFQAMLQRSIRKSVLQSDDRWKSGFDPIERDYLSATAAQRADAFLLVMG